MFAGLIWLLVRILSILIFFGTPLFGFWLASSLAAYLGGPPWMAWLAGALLFPIIPGAWEFRAWTYRRPESKPWFTPVDRLGLRTFAVSLVFLAGLLYLYPQTAFVSLSTRGDWMLDGVKDPRAEKARRVLFAAAGGLEWLYDATKTNPYKALVDPKARQLAEKATQEREQEAAKRAESLQQAELTKQSEVAKQSELGREAELGQHTEEESARKENQVGAQRKEQERPQTNDQDVAQTDEQNPTQKNLQDVAQPAEPTIAWPCAPTLHPAVLAMPASAETSIRSVARYIAQHEPDPLLRIKALHDYVADRIAYDVDALRSGHIPDQDAETTFRTRKSVCAGYANLLAALADSIDEKIVVVGGDARDPSSGDKLTGMGHAWNAASVNHRWYLLDACWDAGSVYPEKGFVKRYKTEYLLCPPVVMIQTHFPDRETWQLLDKPLSQGEFLRQPMLRPRFQADDLTLLAPERAQNETGSTAVVLVKNPKHRWLMTGLEQNGKKIECKSDPTNSDTAHLECLLPDKGKYRLNMFVNPHDRYGAYDFVGAVDFVNR